MDIFNDDYNINLKKIEKLLLNHKSIGEVVVVVREDEIKDRFLCAYIVSKKEFTELEIRSYLCNKIPEYLIPSYFIEVDNIPLTSSGKVDIKTLPNYESGRNLKSLEYEGPRNEIEEKLVDIWEEILQDKQGIGIKDMFSKLGGDYLKGIALATKVCKEFNMEIPLLEILKRPTIEELSEYIQSKDKSIYNAIERVEEKEYYPLSSAQKRMFIINQLDKNSVNYNAPIVLSLKGKLNKEKLESIFNKLVKRHESFRTSFEMIEGNIAQRIRNRIDFKIEYIENSMHGIEKEVEDFIRPFNLSKAPLLRVKLIKESEDVYILMIDMHHIISDGVSQRNIIEEFSKLYNGEALPELRIQYKDYAVWQHKRLNKEEFMRQEKYWLRRFKGEIPVLNMPTDYPRPSLQSFEGSRVKFKVGKVLTEKLERLSNQNEVTLYMTLLTAYNILLHRYTGQDDIIVGSPIAGRRFQNLENIIGMFVNTLAMRNNPTGNKTFKEFLIEVKENTVKAYDNQDYQFEELVEKLDIKRDMDRNPLFDTMFSLQNINIDIDSIKLDKIKIERYEIEYKISKCDITLTAWKSLEGIDFLIEYSTKLFRKDTIERLAEHYKNILEEITKNIEVKIKEIKILSKEEKKNILYDFNDTKADYYKEKTIHQLFEEQVERTPDKIAIVYEDKQLTYKELNKKANQLARVLRKKGIETDTIVGIMVKRSIEMLIGIMGILKAGGAYLPIDPDYPQDRIQYMLNDSSAGLLLTEKSLMSKVIFDGEIIDIKNNESYNMKGSNLENINNSKDLAYVIYTSGSTGEPKGVMIEHKQVNNFIHGITNKIDFLAYKTILNITTISFDIFVLETVLPLTKGLKVVVADEETSREPKKLKNLIIKEKIEMMQGTSSRIKLLMSDDIFRLSMGVLKVLMIGGEELPQSLLKELNKYKEIDIYNMYGPTETTVWSTVKNLKGCEVVNIGKPISNTQIYIVDRNNNLQPIGVHGELCVSGDGVVRGYLNRPKLTKEKFIENPFIQGERMYKTGDLTRWLADGNIEFLGRIDNQVKIRGYRIELGEIESILLKHDAIKEAIVTAKKDDEKNKYLCAYIILEKNLTITELREYISKELPHYMIPTHFVQLDKIPLTNNGKVDRKTLTEKNGHMYTAVKYEAPRNEIEIKLVEILQEVLHTKQKIGINDNFFELGGHSLKATKVASKIYKELNVQIPLLEIFKRVTIKEISEYIRNLEKSTYESIERAEEKEYYPLSSAQNRMYFINQLGKNSINYNMSSVMIIKGVVDKEKLERTFLKLINRHEPLRTSFEIIEGKPKQKIQKKVDFKIDYIENKKHEVEKEVKDFIRPFKLSKAPLLRVGLITETQDENILMVDMHHIISDGVSMRNIIEEFSKLYSGEDLPELRIQYKDYAVWQQKRLNKEEFKRQEKYWLEKFTGEIQVLNIPTDYDRPPVQSFKGDDIKFELNSALSAKVKQIANETSSTVYMLLLAVYNVLLFKYTGQEDIIVGTPTAGRTSVDLENIVGLFVNTLAMRNYPKGEKTFIEFLEEVKITALRAYENQDYQFENLVGKLDLKWDLSRNPIFDTIFAMQNVDRVEIKIKDLKAKPYTFKTNISKFDLALAAIEAEEKIIINLQYCTDLFSKETMLRLCQDFKAILLCIVKNSKTKLKDICILNEKEKDNIESEIKELNEIKNMKFKF